MKIGNFKGALLEYVIRKLLTNCGFTNVKAKDPYSYKRCGLFFVNGKGAAHDADIIMNPPIQMPFHYPTQLIFECKAYKDKARLPIVRNALGLRNDLNDFEIVDIASLNVRKNNRRSSLAIETRNRFLYQIGVASINDFSKPAIEFSANNKIPLISLSWFFSTAQISNVNNLNQEIIDSYDVDDIKNVYDYFKDRTGKLTQSKYERAKEFLETENEISEIVNFANLVIEYSYVGVLETGDIIFLFAESPDNLFANNQGFLSLKAEIHWRNQRPNLWELTVSNQSRTSESIYKFFLPNRLFDYWGKFSLDKSVALDIKQQYFSKIFVFNRKNNLEIPFSIVNINKEWLDGIREQMNPAANNI